MTTHPTPPDQGDERRAFDLYWLARQRQRGFGAALTDAEMLSHPEDRADEFLAWQAARALPAAGVSIEEYRRVVSRCIELGEKIAALSVVQPVAQEASVFLEVPDVQDESGINTHYSRELVLQCIESALEHRALAASHPSQGAEGPKQNWAPYLSDRADGVRGHFAIARWNTSGYREVWNLRTHQWSAFSDEVLTQAEAEAMLKSISFAAPPPSVSADAGKGVIPPGCEKMRGGKPVTFWRDDALEAAAGIVEAYGANPQIATDIRAMKSKPSPSESVAVSGEVSEDTKRLDYLQQRGATVEILPGGAGKWMFRIGGSLSSVSYDIRAAIDHAVLALAGSGGKEAAALERMARLDDEMGEQP